MLQHGSSPEGVRRARAALAQPCHVSMSRSEAASLIRFQSQPMVLGCDVRRRGMRRGRRGFPKSRVIVDSASRAAQPGPARPSLLVQAGAVPYPSSPALLLAHPSRPLQPVPGLVTL